MLMMKYYWWPSYGLAQGYQAVSDRVGIRTFIALTLCSCPHFILPEASTTHTESQQCGLSLQSLWLERSDSNMLGKLGRLKKIQALSELLHHTHQSCAWPGLREVVFSTQGNWGFSILLLWHCLCLCFVSWATFHSALMNVSFCPL